MTLSRKALKDFTFSDGTFIPKGTLITAPTVSLHHDKNFYENPDVFEPFRFAHMREEDGKGTKRQFASMSTEYVPFGLGKNVWYDLASSIFYRDLLAGYFLYSPGRFFAAIELKFMLAHLLVTYDVKLEDNTTHPQSWHIGTYIAANPRAKVLFRNRVD